MIQRLDKFPYHELSIEERIMLAGDIWDSVVAQEDAVPVPDWHREIIKQRLAAYDADPTGTITWDAFRLRIKALRDSRMQARK